ncbi:MAG: hypothetical protein S4CHLAM45_09340 [Chlamydiales bacterium]|nr:hypothetical protein [Chlamydiales bacterium]MCH9620085.1 hypothetical protein [Chlamydiales bacterium]MCH9623038.1 hypothetical protein [Chlamydiales bacterium]
MRRSLCITEPSSAHAGQVDTWRFHYTTASSLPKGAKLKFDIRSSGREIDWEVPTANLKKKSNVIYAVLEDGELLEAKEVETPGSEIPQYEFQLPSPVKTGQKFSIVVGAPPKAKEKDFQNLGNGCQLSLKRRRAFNLYIDPKGKGNYDDPEVFTIDIRGNKLDTIKIFTPSFVTKNKRFDITVRFEDEYGNLTSFAPEDTLIDLSYEHIRENLNWKLFVPETGFVVLPNLYFNEAGIYKIQLRNLKAETTFTSSPIKCFQENEPSLFWGLLHGESEKVDSTENIETCLRHFRDERVLNFLGSSNFESEGEVSLEAWKLISQNISDFNEEDRFTTFLGFQYEGDPKKEGVRQILYAKDNKPLLKRKDNKSSTLDKLYKTSNPKEMVSIPTFTMGKGHSFDFKAFNPEFERVVEIYNAWGSSEQTKKNGNTLPITGSIEEVADGSIVSALKQNCRFGFVAGGLDERGIYAALPNTKQKQYSPGLTAIASEKFTREGLIEALYNRACYATTGARIIIGFSIAGYRMGSELTTAKKPGLAVNRHISGYIAATSPIKTVEVIRNGEVIHTFKPTEYHFDYFHDDMENLSKITLKKKGQIPFVFYYLRVTQQDGHIGWSSPIWVDHE